MWTRPKLVMWWWMLQNPSKKKRGSEEYCTLLCGINLRWVWGTCGIHYGRLP